MHCISVNPSSSTDSSIWCPSIDFALIYSKNYPTKEIFIIGGAQIFKEALDKNLVDRIYMSRIGKKYEGDIYFPDIITNGKDAEWEGEIDQYGADFDMWIYTKIKNKETQI